MEFKVIDVEPGSRHAWAKEAGWTSRQHFVAFVELPDGESDSLWIEDFPPQRLRRSRAADLTQLEIAAPDVAEAARAAADAAYAASAARRAAYAADAKRAADARRAAAEAERAAAEPPADETDEREPAPRARRDPMLKKMSNALGVDLSWLDDENLDPGYM